MKRKILLLVCLLMAFNLLGVSAEENAKKFITGKQDYLILGSIHDINDDSVVMTVDQVIGSEDQTLVGTDIKVSKFLYSYCDEHAPGNFNNPIISDNVVISLEQKDNKYQVVNGAYKVDSNEYASCRVLVHEDMKDKDCLGELLKVTCYIRSNARVKEFEFDEEGRIYAVYPQTPEQCLKPVDDKGVSVVSEDNADALPTVPPPAPVDNNESYDDNRWIFAILILVVGVSGGLFVSFLTLKKNSVKK